VALLSGCGPPGSGPSASAPDTPPSIILVMIDTLRADYVGSYGFAGDITPHLDALAAESHRFARCYSQAPWTKPSVASLFTSLYPAAHGVDRHAGRIGDPDVPIDGVLADEAVTLAESLADQGYRTAAFIANPWISEPYGFGQGFETYDDDVLNFKTPASDLLDKARAWMESLEPDEPFFLYLHFIDVHGPYESPEWAFDAVRDMQGVASSRTLSRNQAAKLPDYLLEPEWVGEPPTKSLTTWRARYAAGVRVFDEQFGVFVDELRTGGWLDRTALVVTSDHGEELCEAGRWGHGHTLLENQTRVPLLIRPPGGEAGGRVHDDVVGLVDLMPTLLALGGGTVPAGLDGRDLTPELEGRSSGPGAAFSTGVKNHPDVYSLVIGTHKLVMSQKRGALELFDVEADPTERNNLAAHEPRITAAMAEQLRAIIEVQQQRGPFEAAPVPLSDERSEALRALGYTR
jgi:choline-sulfatase